MKIIFEENDLVMRAIIAKKNVSEDADPNKILPTDKLGVIGWFVGFKTNKDDVYNDSAIVATLASMSQDEHYGRYYGYVTCEGGIPNIPSKKGISIILGDEQKISQHVFSIYSNLPEIKEREQKILEHAFNSQMSNE